MVINPCSCYGSALEVARIGYGEWRAQRPGRIHGEDSGYRIVERAVNVDGWGNLAPHGGHEVLQEPVFAGAVTTELRFRRYRKAFGDVGFGEVGHRVPGGAIATDPRRC